MFVDVNGAYVMLVSNDPPGSLRLLCADSADQLADRIKLAAKHARENEDELCRLLR